MKRRRTTPQQQQGGGNLLFDILTLPILGIPRMVHWISKTLVEAAEQEYLDEGKLMGQLLTLQMRYELGELTDDEYAEHETAILDRLSAVRHAKGLD